MGGVNTNLSVDGSFVGGDFSHSQGTAGRTQPAYSGKMVRVDLSDFSSSGVEVGLRICTPGSFDASVSGDGGAHLGLRASRNVLLSVVDIVR